MRIQAWFLVFICLASFVGCQTKAKDKNKTLGVVLIAYNPSRIPNINPHALKDMNKWQMNPANKEFVTYLNPIYWGSEDSQFDTKPLLWGTLYYKDKKQFIVIDDHNQLWYDQDGEFDNIPYNVQLEMTTKSSKTNLYKTYGPYPLNSIFPLFVDDYASIGKDSLTGQIKMELCYSRIIKFNEEDTFAVLELILQ